HYATVFFLIREENIKKLIKNSYYNEDGNTVILNDSGEILILLTGSLTISFLMYYNYNPVKKLKTFIDNNWLHEENYDNDLEMFRAAILDLSNKSRSLQERVNNSSSAVKEFLLHNILKGNVKSIEEFNQKGKEIGISFTNRNFRTIILSFPNNNNNNIDNNIIKEDIERELSKSMEAYGKDSVNTNQLIFIIATEDISNSILEIQLRYIQQYLLDKYQITTTIGVSSSYQNFNTIGKSYIEASTALDYRLIKGKGKVIFFNEILSKESNFHYYPIKELDELEKSLLQADIDQINKIVSYIIDMIKEQQTPLFMARCLCFDIINTILKTSYDFKDKHKDKDIAYPDVITLTQFNTIEELANLVQIICLDICNYLKKEKENEKKLMKNIYQYILEHYHQYNFSVQGMADFFNMSSPHLSQ
ncbi:MAG: hypothetical protein ACOCRU_01180, partial [bacterium]